MVLSSWHELCQVGLNFHNNQVTKLRIDKFSVWLHGLLGLDCARLVIFGKFDAVDMVPQYLPDESGSE